MLKLHKLIIHEVIKKENQQGQANCIISEMLLNIDTKKIEMINELDSKYSLMSQTLGVFDEDGKNELPKDFNKLTDPSNDYDLFQFSKDSTNRLIPYISSQAKAKGGYLIFAEYEIKHKFIGVFFVRNRKGSTFELDSKTKSYQISDSVYIDIDNMAMAVRVNLNAKSINNRYISFINKASIDSQYFLNWFCAIDRRNSREDTNSLHKILKNITPPAGLESDDFVNSVYNYIRALPKGDFVNLKSIGLSFYEDDNYLVKYANENGIVLNHEFKADKATLTKFVQLKAKADKITLNFPLEYLRKKKVRIEGNLIIINSETLVSEIKNDEQDFNNFE